jgi:AcrR family transcriptional regulator
MEKINWRRGARTSRSDLTGRAAGAPNRSSRYDEKQRAILRAATIAFNDKGVRGANLAAIAEAVSLTTASITYYYKKKEELAAICFLQGIATYAKANRIPPEINNATERLSAIVERHFQLWHDIVLGRCDRPMLFDDIRTLTKPHSSAVAQAYVDMFRHLRGTLFRDTSLDRIDRNARTHLVLGSLLWLPAWIFHRDTDDCALDAAQFSDLLANGFARDRWRPEIRPVISIFARESSQREAFLRAATQLINEHGYHGASVEKISARLNVSKGSFYHHNQTKDELVLECFERTFTVIRKAQSEGRALSTRGIDRLRATCGALAEYQLSDRGPLLRSTALQALPKASRDHMIARMNRLSGRFADMITDGIIDGSIRPVNAQIGGQLVNPLINGAAGLRRWAPGVSAKTVARRYVDPLLRGLFR